MKREDFTKDIVDSIMKRLVSREKQESPFNNRLQRTVEGKFPRSTALDTVKYVSAIITMTRAVQEKMFVVFRSSLADAHGIRKLKFVSKFMSAKVTEIDS